MSNPNASTAYSFFMSRGYSSAQAAGIVGNLLGESSLNTGAVGDSGLAKGIAQWHPDRWDPLVSRFKAQGKDPYDFQTQLEMVDWELRNKETKAFNNLMSAKTVDEATAAFIGFERPQGFSWDNPRGGHNYSGRLNFASQVFGTNNGNAAPAPLTFAASDRSAMEYSVPSPAVAEPSIPVSVAQQYALDQAEEEEDGPDVSLWQGVQDAVGQDWSLSYLFRDNPRMAPDPNFRATPELVKELTAGIPEENWDRFSEATSEAHARAMRASMQKDLEAQARLASMGPTGVALRIAAGLTDPLAWAAAAGISAASAGVGAPAALAARFGRVGLIAEGAIVGAASNTLTDALIVQNNYTTKGEDLIWSAGLGLVLGGALGGLARNPATAAEARMIETAGRDLMQSTSMTPGGSTVGAAFASVRQDLRASTHDFRVGLDDTNAPRGFLANARYDLAAQFKASENPLVRGLGNVLVEDGTRNADGLTPIGASEWQTLLDRRAMISWRKGFDGAWKEYAKRNEIPWHQRDQRLAQFSRDVTAYVRNRDALLEWDPAVAKAGNTFRDLMGKWADLASDPGQVSGRLARPVRGAEELKGNAYYVPRIFDHGAIQNALNKYGHDTLTNFVAGAIKAAGSKLEPELIDKMAKAYVNRMHSLSAGELMSASRVFSGEDLDELGKMLTDLDIPVEEVDAIVKSFKPKPQDGATPRLKHRVIFDENFTMRLDRTDSTGSDTVRLSDLFVNDADFLMTSYSRQMSGRVAMANVQIKKAGWKEGDEGPEYLVDGITSDGEWRTLMEEMRSLGDSVGAGKNYKADRERLDFVYNSIIGRPNFDEGSWQSQGLRMFRDYNFLRVMNQVGFAQLSEVANATSQLGWKAMLGNMPSLKSLWRNARTGKLDDALAQEVEDLIGTGTDWVRHSTMTRMDEFGNPFGGSMMENGVIAGIDRTLQKGKKITSAISGMAPVNTLLQRWTGRAIFQKFAQDALKGTAATKRMKALGLSDDMLKRVQAQIKQHATFDGGRLKMMNHKKWDDQEALAAFEGAAFRLSRSIIQENDLGQMNKFMSSPMMRTVLQFRSFMLAAWSKQTMQGLNMRDWQAFMAFTSSTLIAGLAYTSRTYLNSIGRSDQQEYLKEKLDPGKLAGAALQNSSWFSILAPAMDTAWTSLLGNDESLFVGRNTQLASNLIWGNPTADLGNRVLGAMQHGRAMLEGRASQSDVRGLLLLTPFQNALGLSNAYSALISRLPD
jgi:hypothetical protein